MHITREKQISTHLPVRDSNGSIMAHECEDEQKLKELFEHGRVLGTHTQVSIQTRVRNKVTLKGKSRVLPIKEIKENYCMKKIV